jgi:hypothetical protein
VDDHGRPDTLATEPRHAGRSLPADDFDQTPSDSGVLIRLTSDLTYQILDSANQPVCSATGGAVYTRTR